MNNYTIVVAQHCGRRVRRYRLVRIPTRMWRFSRTLIDETLRGLLDEE